MKYLVVEAQKFENGNVAQITTVHPTRESAEQKFHEILMYAAVSQLPIHSACILEETLRMVKNESYYHDVPEEPEEAETN